ncbi:MAG: CpaF family protein [Bdellovibrionaceae bacterium]|nr:CpaF family protein [Pseudobdellovibrionaceae bacterium]MDW8189397.1 CpaF family protein [Pseudobdellovibrionaceae bacterium]
MTKSSVVAAAVRNFLGPITELWDDPTISEILINGPHEIFVEKKGILYKTDKKFSDEDSLRAAVNNIAQSVGRRISEDEPRLDARLPDGSRVAVVIPPCARNGTTVSIRKFTQSQITFKEYIALGSITQEAALFLNACVLLGKNLLVSGGTGSGKTTLLSLLCSYIPKTQRIIVIEDSSELKIQHDHVVFFETKQADQMGKGEVTIRDLLKSALRLRPDRIIVGEVRSSEALELIQAMNTGHKGSMGTVHANTPEDAIVRLEALASGGDTKLSEKALRYQVASAVELIVQISRLSDGSRKVTSISEVVGFDEKGAYNVVPIYHIPRLIRGTDGRLHGRLEPTGNVPSFLQELIDNKLPFSAQHFRAS